MIELTIQTGGCKFDPHDEADLKEAPLAPFIVDVMKMQIASRNPNRFNDVIKRAVVELEAAFSTSPRLLSRFCAFADPHLALGLSNYAPLHVLAIGATEKLNRDRGVLPHLHRSGLKN